MQYQIILKVLGILLMAFSVTLLPPVAIALIYQDGEGWVFASTFFWLLTTGFILWYPVKRVKRDLKTRDGFIIVVMFWTVLGFAGALPIYFAQATSISATDAIFEAYSGLTTTGATVLSGLDHLPHALRWYRQQLEWFGGMGIIVLAVAILPMLGIGGMQLYKAEAPGPVKDNKLAPRISETAKALWYIYIGLTLTCAVAFRMAGMNWFDAITHSFSTVAIGGFSTYDASIGHFNSVQVELVTMFFMFFAGINFALHFTAFRKLDARPYLFDVEVRAYSGILLVAGLVTTLYLYQHEVYQTWSEAFRYGYFQAISIVTTTGYANTDFSVWPAFIPIFLIILSFIGGSASSTAGGMKVIRAVLLVKQSGREIRALLHPNAIMPVKLNGKVIPERVMTAVWGFFSLYIISFIVITLILMALEVDFLTAFTAVAAMLNNLGPGLGEVSSNYASLSDPVKWVLTFTMLLGRLELFTLLVLFTRAFWRS